MKDYSHVPFKPKNLPFFYGWVIIFASTIGTIASIPGQTMGVSVFTDDLIVAFDLPRIHLSAAYMLGTICSSLILPHAGKFFDSYGARITSFGAAVFLGIFLFGLSWAQKITALILPYPFSFGICFFLAAFCFLGIRFFGQGVITMASRAMLGKWFNKRRGLAVGLSGVFVAFGFGGAPQILNHFITRFGWETTLVGLSLVVGGSVSLFVWIFFRDNPEDCGLVQDGLSTADYNSEASSLEPLHHNYKEFTAKEAKKTLTFWIFNLALTFQAFLITAITFHIADIAKTMGIERSDAFSLFLPIAVVSTLTNLLAGIISDRIPHKYIVAIQMVGSVIAILGVINLNHRLGFWSTIIGLGISNGTFSCLSIISWPRFFGRKHLGEISGCNMAWMVFASGIAPFTFSLSIKFFDNYTAAFLLSLIPPIVLFFLSWKGNNPQQMWACSRS